VYDAIGNCEYANFSNTRLQERLELKEGMRVMALRNDFFGKYQNGSLGTIRSLREDSVIVYFDNGNLCEVERAEYQLENKYIPNECITVYQFPLSGGYACTIHKSQGQTFDCANIDIDSCWEPGQWYVALSRVRTVEGIHLLKPLRLRDLLCDSRVVAYYNNLQKVAV